VRIRKKTVVVVGSGAATVLAVSAGSQPAGALTQTRTEEFDFVTASGDPVTCTVEAVNTLRRDFTFDASTRVVGGPAACYDSTAYLTAEYTDSAGNPVTAELEGEGGVGQSWSVGNGRPKTWHRVQFDDCGYTDPGLCTTPTYSFVGCAL
jgi:hypothetical protein